MQGRDVGLGGLSALGLVLVAAGLVPPAAAVVAACSPNDFADAVQDVAFNPSLNNGPVLPNSTTGFDKLDVLGVCLTEDAAHVLVIVTLNATVGSESNQDLHWNVTFSTGGQNILCGYHHVGGTPSTTGPCAAESDAARVQFAVAKSGVAPGTTLRDFAAAANGTFVAPVAGILTASDRAPHIGAAPFSYVVGARAPADQDGDDDGFSDRDEVAARTDPGRPDTDEDGLLDGSSVDLDPGSAQVARFRALGILELPGAGAKVRFAGERAFQTNATRADTDRDGLLDGGNVTVPEGSSAARNLTSALAAAGDLGGKTPVRTDAGLRFLGEHAFGTSPTSEDADADGLTDLAEVLGLRNTAFSRHAHDPTFPGSTDPAARDTDRDGLADGEEVAGRATVDGTSLAFSPTDPNAADTDGDGLADLDEVRGVHTTPAGKRISFKPTDPTKQDTDGDGVNDFSEVQQGHDPTDPNDRPRTQPVTDLPLYLAISGALLLLVVLLSVGGIVWRWG